MNNDFLYEENILEVYRNPRNKRELFLDVPPAPRGGVNAFEETEIKIVSAIGDNPDCGDSGTLYLKLKKIEKDFLILEASFLGNGCVISQAAFEMLAGELSGKLISEVRFWSPAKIYELLKIPITPTRVNCALLGYRALEKILVLNND